MDIWNLTYSSVEIKLEETDNDENVSVTASESKEQLNLSNDTQNKFSSGSVNNDNNIGRNQSFTEYIDVNIGSEKKPVAVRKRKKYTTELECDICGSM